MNPATKALSSIASAAANGIAGLIFLTRTGILAHPNRVRADSLLISSRIAHWRLDSSRRANY
jgi:hypothetical protein